MKHDTNLSNSASYTLDVDYWDLGELNMADPSNLIDFVSWAMTNYSADQYCLVLSDHGNGWEPMSIGQPVPKGTLWDDTNGDYMATADLGNALSAITSGGTEKLDVLFLDACLEQMIEVGYEVKDYSQYLVTSEYIGYGPGPYDDYISSITATTTAEQLAATIVNDYHNWLAGSEYAHTMSAVDLSQYASLASAVDDFAQALIDGLPAYQAEMESSRSACQKFYTDYYGVGSYLDLYHLAYRIDQNIADATIQAAAEAVMTAVDNAVIAEAHENGDDDEYYQVDNAHGISIYFPPSEENSGYSDYNSSNLAFVADQGWEEFLAAFFGPTSYSLTISSTSGGNVTTPGEGTYSPYSPGDVVDLVATADPGYDFTGWTGDTGTIADSGAASTNITMNGDYSITANFAIVVEPFWAVPIVADAGVEGANTDLEFGIHPDASDGYDSDIDVPHPPPGPIPPSFEACFSIVNALFPELDKDFRGTTPNEWTLKVKSTSQNIELTWNATGIPPELCAVMDTGTERIDMKAQDSVVLGVGNYTIAISVSEEVEIGLSLKAGWNMVSVPLVLTENSTSAVFPAVAGIFAWNATSRSYYVPTVIEPEKGYWVAVTGNTTIPVSGIPVDNWTIDIKAGWNLVGSVMCSMDFSVPDTDPAGKVESFSYRWEPGLPGYIYSTTIEPTMGHWIAATENCTLTLDSPEESV